MLKKCLFPVAGYRTRFLPATKAMPKEMLPLVNKPLVQYGVEEAIEAGLTEIGFVTGRGKRAIEDHFDTNFELEHQIAGTGKTYRKVDASFFGDAIAEWNAIWSEKASSTLDVLRAVAAETE